MPKRNGAAMACAKMAAYAPVPIENVLEEDMLYCQDSIAGAKLREAEGIGYRKQDGKKILLTRGENDNDRTNE